MHEANKSNLNVQLNKFKNYVKMKNQEKSF